MTYIIYKLNTTSFLKIEESQQNSLESKKTPNFLKKVFKNLKKTLNYLKKKLSTISKKTSQKKSQTESLRMLRVSC